MIAHSGFSASVVYLVADPSTILIGPNVGSDSGMTVRQERGNKSRLDFLAFLTMDF
jgi:hypothetical protein